MPVNDPTASPPQAAAALSPSSKDTWSSFSSRAEALVKAGAAVGILCYAVGLIVTNSYLTRYGVTDFSALRPQCILTGAWSTALILLAGLPSVVAALTLSTEADRPSFLIRLKAIGFAAFTVLFVYMVVLVLEILLVNPFERSFNAELPGWNGIMLLMNGLPLLMLIALPEAFADVRESASSSLILFGPFVFLSCFAIGNNMYEVIAPQMGGGRPQHGVLYFATEEKALPARLRANTAPFHDKDPEGAITGDLIYMGGDRYAFRVVYCGPAAEAANSKELVYKEQDFVADKKTMQAFFLQGLGERRNGDVCPL